jgi:hypothetical protein
MPQFTDRKRQFKSRGWPRLSTQQNLNTVGVLGYAIQLCFGYGTEQCLIAAIVRAKKQAFNMDIFLNMELVLFWRNRFWNRKRPKLDRAVSTISVKAKSSCRELWTWVIDAEFAKLVSATNLGTLCEEQSKGAGVAVAR